LAEKLIGFTRDTFERAEVIDDLVQPAADEDTTSDGFLRRLMHAARDAVERADDHFRPTVERGQK